MDIADREIMVQLFKAQQFDKVVHLAAQAGLRYSIENPMAYADSNLIGHLNILEGCRNNQVKHLIYAYSSSVYGLNNKVPFSTKDTVDLVNIADLSLKMIRLSDLPVLDKKNIDGDIEIKFTGLGPS